MDDGLFRLARTVCEEAGFSPEVVSDTMVSAALRRAMGASGMTIDGFERALSTDGKVRDALLEELLVRESWFWRDVRPFEWLGEHLRHRGWPARGHFSALSAPCANGEEAYSLALLCAQLGIAAEQSRIDALDLSRQGLDRARRGLYRPRALESLPLAFRRAEFTESEDGQYQLSERIRCRVRFRRGNLLDGVAIQANAPYDVIFCRNLLIYLTENNRARVLEQVAASLAPDGVLILGHAEAALLQGRPFVAESDSSTFAFRPAGVVCQSAAPVAAQAPALSRRVSLKPARRPPPVQRPALPGTSLPPAPVESRAGIEAARRLADEGRYAEALALVLEQREAHKPDADCEHLVGLLYAALADRDAARRAFERALYLDPKHLPTLEQLALVLEGEGEAGRAVRLRSRAAAVSGNAQS